MHEISDRFRPSFQWNTSYRTFGRCPMMNSVRSL